jgi:hypothetical protein
VSLHDGGNAFRAGALEQADAIVASLAEIERAIQIIGRKDRGISRAKIQRQDDRRYSSYNG